MSERREVDRAQLERHLDHELKKRGLTRRDLIKGGMGMATALGLGSLFAACGGGGEEAAPPAAEPAPAGEPAAPPAEGGEKFTGTMRVLGIGVDLVDPIKEAGEKALGFKLAFDVKTAPVALQQAITQPGSFDVFSGYQSEYDPIFPAGSLQPIEIAKLTYWDQMNPLMTQGRVDPSGDAPYGDGDAPFRQLYMDPDKSGTWKSNANVVEELQGLIVQWVDESTGQTAGEEPKYVTNVPGNFNMDSVGYNTDVIPKEPEEVSWGELLNPAYSGRVALLADPQVAYQDVGNAARALGLLEFGDLGNMTKEEIDALVNLMIDFKKKGHFRAFWADFNESVTLMESGEVVIESMWSPAVSLLQAKGFPVRYAAPPEGFRGWQGGNSISSAVKDPAVLQAAYDYLNWWNSGEPGGIMMRQGYYNAVQETAREFVTPEDWDFWIDGKPAAVDLVDPFGNVSIKAGTVRDGGSLLDRSSNFASWNSFFGEGEYANQRWNDFLTS